MAQDIAILDFGSSKISVLIGERGVNDTICLKGNSAVDYAGFSDGEWFDSERLPQVIAHAISTAESSGGCKITRLYVGVPGEFTSVVCKNLGTTFSKRKKVTNEDVFKLKISGDTFNQDTHDVINIQPIYYTLDNDRLVTVSPVGISTTKFNALYSYVLAEVSFTGFIRSILGRLGITDIEFVSSVLAESVLLFDEEKRNATAVLIDVGYITTSVAVVRGDGLLSLNSFSMGGGHIEGDLSEALEITYPDAVSLKREVMLSLNTSSNHSYKIESREGTKLFNAQFVNEVVEYRIQAIANMIAKCLERSDYEFPDYIPFSLTGGGICYIRGAKDILAQCLGRNVEIVTPKFPQLNLPNLSSSLGVLDFAISSEEPAKNKLSLFARLFKNR